MINTRLQELIERNGGVVALHQEPSLRSSVLRAMRRGDLVRILPGVGIHPSLVDEPMARLRAAALWLPGAVFCRRAAAKLTFWPHCTLSTIELIHPTPARQYPGYRTLRVRTPAELTQSRGAFTVTIPALTVLDLASVWDSEALCEALRVGATEAGQLARANRLIAGRSGAQRRALLIKAAHGRPWSVAELDLQLLLREHKIFDWTGNYPVRLGDDIRFADIAFPKARLIIEVDGWAYHSDLASFESDRSRQNAFTLAGWTVLRFTYPQIHTDPESVIATIRAALTRCRRRAYPQAA